MAGKKIEAELGLTGSEEETAAIAKMQAQQRGKMARKVRSLLPCASRPCWSLCSRSSAERPGHDRRSLPRRRRALPRRLSRRLTRAARSSYVFLSASSAEKKGFVSHGL